MIFIGWFGYSELSSALYNIYYSQVIFSTKIRKQLLTCLIICNLFLCCVPSGGGWSCLLISSYLLFLWVLSSLWPHFLVYLFYSFASFKVTSMNSFFVLYILYYTSWFLGEHRATTTPPQWMWFQAILSSLAHVVLAAFLLFLKDIYTRTKNITYFLFSFLLILK